MKQLLSSRLVIALIALNAIVFIGLGVREVVAARGVAERKRLVALRGATGLERIGAIKAKDHLRLSEISMVAEKSGRISREDFDYLCGLYRQGPPNPGTKESSTFYVDLLFTLSRPKQFSETQKAQVGRMIAPLLSPVAEDRSMIVPAMAATLAEKIGDRSLIAPLENLQKTASGQAKVAASEALARIKP